LVAFRARRTFSEPRFVGDPSRAILELRAIAVDGDLEADALMQGEFNEGA